MKKREKIKLLKNENKLLKTLIKINCADCQGYEDICVGGCEVRKCPLYQFQIGALYKKNKRLLNLINISRKIREPEVIVEEDFWTKKFEEEILGSK